MKRKLLLSIVLAGVCVGMQAQKRQQSTTAYAITGAQKGSDRWTEVRLIDVQTGEEIKSIYQSAQQVAVLNARTGKPIAKKEKLAEESNGLTEYRFKTDGANGEVIVIKKNDQQTITFMKQNTDGKQIFITRNAVFNMPPVNADQPFATNSAACAYDKKHERLYFTPMGINQLRYIDLKAKDPTVYFFEGEPFGVLEHRHDVTNQITRMVIASDGNGYALTNSGEHLIRFTTGRKPEISDLGAIADDAANGSNSIRSRGGFGGDIVADDQNNLLLVTANRNVFKISIKDLRATWLGDIKGLPRGYSTNGAAVEKGTSIIVSTSTTTNGFYRFDLSTLQAEKISESESVYKASDLANANLISDKKKKGEEAVAVNEAAKNSGDRVDEKRELNVKYKMSAYPNPAIKGGVVNLTFNDFPQGRYQVQLMDINGKLLSAENINVGQRMQIQLLNLPTSLSQGTYLLKIVGDANKEKVLVTEQIVVQ